MNTARYVTRTGESTERVRIAVYEFGRCVFGDRTGLVVFLAAVWTVTLYWRVGFFINDNYTIANTLVAVSEGHLRLGEPTFGSLRSPGTVIDDGTVYGRNYGQIVMALPFLWGMQALGHFVDVPVALVGGWTLVTMALATQSGRILDRRRQIGVVGACLGLVVFVVNLAVAVRPIPRVDYAILALQLSTMVAGGFVGVLAYRLIGSWYGYRYGLIAGVGGVLATPVGFWSVIPKRHVLTTTLVFVSLYALYRSREVETPASPSAGDAYVRYRALAYGMVGLTAWIHAAEGLILFAGVAVADLPTARSNDRRTLAFVGVAFLASLVPFFVTNYLITGSPVLPPRMLSRFGEQTAASQGYSGATTAGGGGSEAADGVGIYGLVPGGLIVKQYMQQSTSFVARYLRVMDAMFIDGIEFMLANPDVLGSVLFRRGYPEAAWVAEVDDNQALSLAVLEAAPMLAALAVVPVRLLAEPPLRSLEALRRRIEPADVVAVVYMIGVVLMYIEYFPMPAQITIRYFTGFYPLLLYLGLRQRPVRRILDEQLRVAMFAYGATVLLGVQLFVVAIETLTLGLGETFQLHAIVALSVASAIGLGSVWTTFEPGRDRAVALALGIGAGLGTDFVLLASLEYFEYGTYILPLVRVLTTIVEVVSL